MKRLLLALGFTAGLLLTATGGNAAYAEEYEGRSRNHRGDVHAKVNIKLAHHGHGHYKYKDRHYDHDEYRYDRHRYKRHHKRHRAHHYRKHLSHNCWCGHSHGHHGRRHYRQRSYCGSSPSFEFSYHW